MGSGADTGWHGAPFAIITVVRGTIANNMCLRILPSSAVFTFLPQTCSSPAAGNFTRTRKLRSRNLRWHIFQLEDSSRVTIYSAQTWDTLNCPMVPDVMLWWLMVSPATAVKIPCIMICLVLPRDTWQCVTVWHMWRVTGNVSCVTVCGHPGVSPPGPWGYGGDHGAMVGLSQ